MDGLKRKRLMRTKKKVPVDQIRHAYVEEMLRPWQPQSGSVPRERAAWQALYTAVGSLKMAKSVCDDLIIWHQGSRPPDKYLRRWAMEIDENSCTSDPALEKVMRTKFAEYKANRHWQFVESNIRAGIRLADEITEKGAIKQPIALSYLGANANFGMDKGEHAAKQATQQQFNMGNVRIVSSRTQPAIKTTAARKARQLIEGEVKVLAVE